MSDKCVAIVVAAGRGERMGAAAGPKQYRGLGGRPVLGHSLATFCGHPLVSHVVTVIHPEDQARYAAAVPDQDKLMPPVAGGKTRQESVLAGLEAIASLEPQIVLVHDAARPFVTTETITKLVNAIEPGIGALPAHRVSDTLKRADDNLVVTDTVPRDGLWCAQTPQGFRYGELLAAHRQAATGPSADSYTDDAAIAEWAGLQVRIVEAPASNFKLTREEDMVLAQAQLGHLFPEYRTGHGYDVHRTEPGDGVVLCGLHIPAPFRLIGHSDADVGLHALTDALLATIAAGDIGSHFPPSDPQWKGVSSDRFLKHANALVMDAGGVIGHADITLVCEAPKIGPHRDAMRERIASILEIDANRVSVKATTNETIGFIGRGEGIAALATATVRFHPSTKD